MAAGESGTHGPATSMPLPPEGAPAPPPMPPAHPPSPTTGPGAWPGDGARALPQPDAGQTLPQSRRGRHGRPQPADTSAPLPPGAESYGQGSGAGSYGRQAAAGSYGQQAGGDLYGQQPASDAYGRQAGAGPDTHGQPQAGEGPRARHSLPPTDAPVALSSHPFAPPQPALPPEQSGGGDSEATQFIPPIPGTGPQDMGYGQALTGSEDGTQLLPPVSAAPPGPGSPDSEATQYIAPVVDTPQGLYGGQGGDSEATQMMPAPVPAEGAEAPQGPPGGSAGPQPPRAHQPPRAPQPQPRPQSQPQPPSQPQPQPGTRQPLPEFENLFRAEPSGPSAPGPRAGHGAQDEAGATQHLPLIDPGEAPQPRRAGHQGPGRPEPQGRAARRTAQRGRRGTVPPALLIGGGLAAVAVIGLLVGLTLSGGEDGEKSAKAEGQAASSSPAGQESPKAPDPAEEQAKRLDALLGDSNNSRSAVVRSVERIKSCKALGKAASDLRAAAKQRNGLVTRLAQLKTDKIPGSAQLNASLKSAWKSSAAADNHYAAWAGQAAGKKGCHKGTARQTSRTAAGNRASGTATAAKKKAAALWNPTAKKYGLTARQFGEL
ncbi:hypothetical protein [Streptomyces axinellae]|uniref:hypothetical protein n=1 Tax=Streptomyces axinellae TaxID=552788 RepID=UPI0031CE683B